MASKGRGTAAADLATEAPKPFEMNDEEHERNATREMRMKPRRHVRAAQKRNLDERPADLLLWFGDGHLAGISARVQPAREVQVGRTNSKRGIGFTVTRKFKSPDWGWHKESQVFDFVLDKDQMVELAAYLQHCVYLLEPLGRKRNGISIAAENAPKARLFLELEDAAKKAHPTYREIEDGEGMVEIVGAPKGGLVPWFKKNRPKQAARIERAFTKRLWAGKP